MNPVNKRQQHYWGIDIGGANLKLCGPSGTCHSMHFPMWTDYQRLSEAIASLIATLSDCSSYDTWNTDSILAVTMTGELADCFQSRREGVRHILIQLEKLVPPAQCRVYSVDGSWLTNDEARNDPWSVAASNWHALTNWSLRLQPLLPSQLNVILDIGSTTVDIIPVRNGRIKTSARTDRQRLQLGQLVYTGMERTPVHAIVRSLTIHGRRSPVMAERFATILDANLVLGCLPDEPQDCDTADGRPRTRQYALARLARMVGEDAETLSEETIIEMARQVCLIQSKLVARALWRNLRSSQVESASMGTAQPLRVLVSGHGRPLVDRLRKFRAFRTVHFDYLEDSIGPSAARCAPALAVSQLCAEHFSGVACNALVTANLQASLSAPT